MDLLIPINRTSDISLRDQIYGAIRVAIVEGTLAPGSKLPSTRELARQLTVSRLTIEDAYARLMAEEYLSGRQGAGTFVSENLTLARQKIGRNQDLSRKPLPLSATAKRAMDVQAPCGEFQGVPFNFDTGTPDLKAFPHALWQRVLAREYRDADQRYFTYGPEQGLPCLRQALAGYLARSRGVVCDADQIVITSGTQQSLDLLTRLMIDPGDQVIVEEPTYASARSVVSVAGGETVAIQVDANGLRTDDLPTRGPAAQAKMILVTPSHQYPTGAMLSLPRRVALLKWAGEHNSLVVEDDYDSELRYDARPVPALAALASTEACLGRVAYLGTFSKVVFPSLRLGYMVLDKELVTHVLNLKRVVDRHPPQHLQSAAATFIEEGHFERHLARMRKRYAERQALLIEQMEQHLSGIAFRNESVQSAGLHVLYRFEVNMSEDALIALALQEGIALRSASACFARPPKSPHIMMGYSNLDEDKLVEGISRLASLLGRYAGQSGQRMAAAR